MFWFQHPKPFNQKAVVMQIVQRKAAQAMDTKLIILDAPAPPTKKVPLP